MGRRLDLILWRDKMLLKEMERANRPANTIYMDDRAARIACTQTPDAVLSGADAWQRTTSRRREPLGDRRLMSFRAAVPERQFLCKGQTKWLARRAMDEYFPKL